MDFTLNNGDFGIVYTNPAEGLKTIGQGNWGTDKTEVRYQWSFGWHNIIEMDFFFSAFAMSR
jgi:hypothetical protein